VKKSPPPVDSSGSVATSQVPLMKRSFRSFESKSDDILPATPPETPPSPTKPWRRDSFDEGDEMERKANLIGLVRRLNCGNSRKYQDCENDQLQQVHERDLSRSQRDEKLKEALSQRSKTMTSIAQLADDTEQHTRQLMLLEDSEQHKRHLVRITTVQEPRFPDEEEHPSAGAYSNSFFSNLFTEDGDNDSVADTNSVADSRSYASRSLTTSLLHEENGGSKCDLNRSLGDNFESMHGGPDWYNSLFEDDTIASRDGESSKGDSIYTYGTNFSGAASGFTTVYSTGTHESRSTYEHANRKGHQRGVGRKERLPPTYESPPRKSPQRRYSPRRSPPRKSLRSKPERSRTKPPLKKTSITSFSPEKTHRRSSSVKDETAITTGENQLGIFKVIKDVGAVTGEIFGDVSDAVKCMVDVTQETAVDIHLPNSKNSRRRREVYL